MGDECIRDKTVIEMCEMKIIPKDNNDEINLQPMQNYTAGQEIVVKDMLDENLQDVYKNSTTKLRAEALPFTPECIAVDLKNSSGKKDLSIGMIDQVYCFENVDLVIPEVVLKPLPEILLKKNQNNTKSQEFEELNIPSPEIENGQNAEEVASETISPVMNSDPTTAEIQRHPRRIFHHIIFENKTQIAALIFTLMICGFLILYVLP